MSGVVFLETQWHPERAEAVVMEPDGCNLNDIEEDVDKSAEHDRIRDIRMASRTG